MKFLKKIYNFFVENKVFLLTFIFASFIILYEFYESGVIPFGKYSLLCIDFYHQYGPMTYEYVHRLLGNGSLVYSFYQGLGLPIYRNFLNYLSSPVNLLLLFFNKSNHLSGLSLVIGLKAVLSALTCSYYLSKKFKTNNILLVPISLLYAYSAYYRAYYWNLMWIDGMIMLPLITLGIESLVKEKKWKLYTFSLFIMIIANYFIAYMICIYSVLYFIIYLVYKTSFKNKLKKNVKDIISKGLLFAGCSLLAGGLSAFLMIPMATSMASISATGGTIPTTQYYNFEFINFIKAHLSSIDSVIFKSDPITTPNVSAGIISIFLVISYLLNTSISKKNKICYLLLYFCFFAIIFVPQLDYIVQAFHVPNDLPYRYSFIYTFILVILSSYALINIDKEGLIKLLLIFLFCVGMVIATIVDTYEGASKEALLINIIVLFLFVLFLLLGKHFKSYRGIFYFALVLVATIDSISSVSYGFNITQIAENFYSQTATMDEKIETIHNYDESLFYRIDSISNHTLNDSAKSFYNGVTTFSSMAYEDLSKLQGYLGNKGNKINSYIYVDQTPIYDIMFDVKYSIGSRLDNKRYTQLSNKDIYKFNYSTGIAFGVNKDIINWEYTNSNPIKVQNDFVEKATHIDNVFNPLTLVDKEEVQNDKIKVINYKYINPNEMSYLYFNTSAISYIKIGTNLYARDDNYSYSNHLGSYNYYSYDDEYIITINSEEEYINIQVGYNYVDDNSVYPFYLDSNKFEEVYEKFKNNSMTLTSFSEDRISGQIYLDDDSTVYTSIPYDEGWEVYVNDKLVNTYSLGNSLLAFNADKGLNKIELRYKIPKLKISLIISTISLAIVCQMIYYDRKKKVTAK